MGAWGAGPFENDDAVDWVWELEDDTDGALLIAAFDAVVQLPSGEQPEAPESSNALAAAEVVASARGHRSGELPTEAEEWIGRHAEDVDDDLVALASAAVDRVLSDSELADLWDDAGDPEWRVVTNALRSRLS